MAKPFEFYIVQALGLDPEQIMAESVRVQFVGSLAQVTWGGVMVIESAQFQDAIALARVTFEKEMEDG